MVRGKARPGAQLNLAAAITIKLNPATFFTVDFDDMAARHHDDSYNMRILLSNLLV